MGKPALVTRREAARGTVARCDTCGYALGSCGCGGGGARALAMGQPSSGAPQPYGVDYNPPGGNGGNWWDNCQCAPGCSPKGFSESRWRKLLRELGMQNKRPPYVDQMADYQEMDTLLSPITQLPVLAAGVQTNIVVQPEGGCFLVAYWRIVVRTEADGLQSVDWTYRKPRIVGCPVPCDNLDRDTMAQFAMSVPEACPCGIPLLAYIQRQGEVLPLHIPVFNGAAAALTGQVEVRGYCCDARVCL